jgi:hypothetical protein
LTIQSRPSVEVHGRDAAGRSAEYQTGREALYCPKF